MVSARDIIFAAGDVIKNVFIGDSETLAQSNRQAILKKVQRFWIEGVLERSLYQVAPIKLGLAEKPDAVEHRPWDIIVRQHECPSRELDPSETLLDFFDNDNQQFLILGAPGSGKTTMLLEIARDLIKRAKESPEPPHSSCLKPFLLVRRTAQFG